MGKLVVYVIILAILKTSQKCQGQRVKDQLQELSAQVDLIAKKIDGLAGCDSCLVSQEPEGFLYAECQVMPNPSNPDLEERVSGTVRFKQKANGGDTRIRINLSGFDTSDTNKFHGFHVHMYGNVAMACEDAGGHYNPFEVNHGGPNAKVRHVGDLGNILEDDRGRVRSTFSDKVISLAGTQSIIGRSIVIHAQKDDLGKGGNEGSLATGNAGARLACCTIAVSDDSGW